MFTRRHDDGSISKDGDKRLAVLEDRMIRHADSVDHVLEEIKGMSSKQGEKIDILCSQLRNLDSKIDVDAKNTDIKIAQSSEKLRDYIHDTFATKQQLKEGFDSIKISVQLMVGLIVMMAGAAAWVFEHFIK